MYQKLKKPVSLALASVMALGVLAGCGESDTPGTSNATTPPATVATDTTKPQQVAYVDPYADLAAAVAADPDDVEAYDALSSAIYHDELGEFLSYYEEALEEKTDISRRYALMALAEAKLMESAVMMPMTTRGGSYGITRVCPHSASSVMWGGDADRFHNRIVVEELLKVEDREALKALWAEKKGTGEWQDAAKAYLTDHGYTLTRDHKEVYASEIKNWDALATSRQPDGQVLVQTYDCLVEYDSENVLQPALAESWEISEDGLTYTFKIREGVDWVDAQGRFVSKLTADDFVAGMQHMMDAAGGLEFLIDGKIVNAHEYITGEITDFAEVGVKAVDDYTLEITLTEPVSFFLTMLPYGCFAPMSRSYYESQGGKFGADYDPSADSYKYGKGPDSIAYCGPFVVTNYTPENTIVFKANASYWNPEGNNLDSVTRLWNDGKDPTKAYTDAIAGTIDGCGLNAAAVEAAKKDGKFDDYAGISATDGTSFMGYYNLNRAAYVNTNDGVSAPSPKDDAAKVRTTAALRNDHFRRAMSFATDRAARNAQAVGEELKLNALRNCYTPGTFVTLEDEVTVDINGKATTFPAGTAYGAIVQAQIDADGIVMTVWDPAADGGIGSSDGFDGWYNPEAAKAEMELAVAELAAMGVEVSAENPIYVDCPYEAAVETSKNRANAYKQGLESVLEGKVIVNLVVCNTPDEFRYTGFQTELGKESNYDFTDGFGWGPDYGDPSSYLDTMLPDYAGYMMKSCGIF